MMQTVIQALILTTLLSVVPFLAGGLLVPSGEDGGKLLFRWVGGQMLLWAGFQMICVPLLLRQADFKAVVALFGGYTGLLLLFALVAEGKRLGLRRRVGIRKSSVRLSRKEFFLGAVFLGLFLFQIYRALCYAYGDGDDAYYVAISTAAESSDRMYMTLAYTGLTTELDFRHGLAPFPIWIAFLARVSGAPVAVTAHLAVSAAMTAMGYGALALIGTQLFQERKKLLLFLIFAELLVLFGGYSLYTAENFMLARSRQGKAALGSLVIPFLLFLLLYLFRRMDEGKAVGLRYYLLLAAAVTSGCLCSTMGALLCCMLIGAAGIVGFFLYRDRKRLLPLLLCCLPGIGYAGLYLWFGR